MTKQNHFDQFASEYDTWFFENMNLLTSEVRLVAHFLKDAGKILSVGCGSGLFETILKKDFNIIIENGIEPSVGMAEIARKRGLNVVNNTAEDADMGINEYDTILYNGTPSHISNLETSLKKAYKALKQGGKVILIDVPKESSFGIMYNLAKLANTWDNELLQGVFPPSPYPIEFVKLAHWRTTDEIIELLKKTGFSDFQFAQTLTNHPIYSNIEAETPIEGYTKGDYVAVCATKKQID